MTLGGTVSNNSIKTPPPVSFCCYLTPGGVFIGLFDTGRCLYEAIWHRGGVFSKLFDTVPPAIQPNPIKGVQMVSDVFLTGAWWLLKVSWRVSIWCWWCLEYNPASFWRVIGGRLKVFGRVSWRCLMSFWQVLGGCWRWLEGVLFSV